MYRFGFQSRLAAILLLAYAIFWTWQTPGWVHGKLTGPEIDRYISALEQGLKMPVDEKSEILQRLRVWALADDGQPVYMLNVMRYYPQLLQFEGAPQFAGTPEQANTYYESSVMPIALSRGVYPLFSGPAQGKNLIGSTPAFDDWSRIIVMRYPSRRAVLDFFSASDYLPYEPYKMMALKVMLTPVSGGMVVPELRWLVGGLLLLCFVTAGWWRAARRASRAGE